MKKLLIIIGLVLLFSCEKQPIECKDCYYVTTSWGPEGNFNTNRWGDFTACGDTLKAINHTAHYVFIEETQCNVVTMIICE